MSIPLLVKKHVKEMRERLQTAKDTLVAQDFSNMYEVGKSQGVIEGLDAALVAFEFLADEVMRGAHDNEDFEGVRID